MGAANRAPSRRAASSAEPVRGHASLVWRPAVRCVAPWPGVRDESVPRVLLTGPVRAVERALPAGSAGCWRRNRGRPLKERLRGPARERDGVVPRQAGDVDEPDDRLDTDGGADAEHELAELLVGEVTTDAVERLGDPGDRTSLTEGERVTFGGVGLEREAQHRSLLRFGVEDHGGEVGDDGVKSR